MIKCSAKQAVVSVIERNNRSHRGRRKDKPSLLPNMDWHARMDKCPNSDRTSSDDWWHRRTSLCALRSEPARCDPFQHASIRTAILIFNPSRFKLNLLLPPFFAIRPEPTVINDLIDPIWTGCSQRSRRSVLGRLLSVLFAIRLITHDIVLSLYWWADLPVQFKPVSLSILFDRVWNARSSALFHTMGRFGTYKGPY